MQKINWKKHSKIILILLLLQLLIDKVYVYLYPTVNPIRATLIGATAFILLWIPWLRKMFDLHPGLAFLPIYVNAFLGALVVQSGLVISKSIESSLVHIGILIITYTIIIWRKSK
tara:strand:+ start:251 stop:595 length:345 start_codon:yes stop_codon:yes gene_type:complete